MTPRALPLERPVKFHSNRGGVFALRWIVVAAGLVTVLSATAASVVPCRIEVRDKQDGWPVPLVQLRTTHQLSFVTDNAGIIAIDAPELFGREVWFDVAGHGYEVPKDGFGMRGVRLKPEPGATLRVVVVRRNIARRLGRATGAGIFAESQKLGLEADWAETGVFGCDSVQNAVHRGKLFWAWGDTTLPHYPLGVFEMTSATTPIQPLASFEPPLRLRFDLFRGKDGRPRGVAKMPGSGPTWLTGYVSLTDKTGTQRLCAAYMKVRNHLEAYEWGLCVWNDERAEFEPLRVLWTKSAASPAAPPVPEGHPAFWRDDKGREWVYFGNPLPTLRCPATFEAWKVSATWQTLSPQKSLPAADGEGRVKLHSGSMAWNEFRRRWVTVFMESGGKPSMHGELWYAEALAPEGPWGRAVKVLTHDNYTFYNPRLHPEFTPTNSPILIFEGTYTQEFADRPVPTPRYNYNQILYRLDLDDAALRAAQGDDLRERRKSIEERR